MKTPEPSILDETVCPVDSCVCDNLGSQKSPSSGRRWCGKHGWKRFVGKTRKEKHEQVRRDQDNFRHALKSLHEALSRLNALAASPHRTAELSNIQTAIRRTWEAKFWLKGGVV